MGTSTIFVGVALLLPVREIWSALPDPPYDDRQLQIRAGYYTYSGKYLGGIPKIESEYELFGCTEFIYDNNNVTSENGTVENATVCARWTADEVNSDEYKKDRCSCRSVQSSGDYCNNWTCTRLEIDHAILLEKEVQSTRCTCEAEHDDSGIFCVAWTCLTTGAHGDRRLEDFQCVRASSLAEYCDAWTGVVTSTEVVRVSTCACVQPLDEAGVCLYWECERRGMKRCSRGGPGWCNLGVSIGVGGFFGSLGALLAAWAIFRLLHRARHPAHQGMYGRFVLLGFFWMAVWSIGVVIWGGRDAAMYVGIWWGVLIVVDLLYACCTNCS